MLPYFEYTEDIHNFCMLMGFTTEITDQPTGYVCTHWNIIQNLTLHSII